MSGYTPALTKADVDAAVALAVAPLNARIDGLAARCEVMEKREAEGMKILKFCGIPGQVISVGINGVAEWTWPAVAAARANDYNPEVVRARNAALEAAKEQPPQEALELELPLPECTMHEKLLVALKTEFIVCAGARNASDNLHLILQPKQKTEDGEYTRSFQIDHEDGDRERGQTEIEKRVAAFKQDNPGVVAALADGKAKEERKMWRGNGDQGGPFRFRWTYTRTD